MAKKQQQNTIKLFKEALRNKKTKTNGQQQKSIYSAMGKFEIIRSDDNGKQ